MTAYTSQPLQELDGDGSIGSAAAVDCGLTQDALKKHLGDETSRMEAEMAELQQRLSVIRQKHEMQVKLQEANLSAGSQEDGDSEMVVDQSTEQNTLMEPELNDDHEAGSQATLCHPTPLLLAGTANSEMAARTAALLEAKTMAEDAIRAESERLAKLRELLHAATLEFGEDAEPLQAEKDKAEQAKAVKEKAEKEKAEQIQAEKAGKENAEKETTGEQHLRHGLFKKWSMRSDDQIP